MKDEKYPMKSLVKLTCVWHRIIERKMADLGLSSIQSRLLGYLYFRTMEGQKVFQKELEEEFQIRKSSITSVIQLLERKGLMQRKAVPEDARQKELVLTEKGIAVQETVLERLEALESMVNAMMTPEEKTVWFSCIRKIETGLKEAEYD